MPMNQSKFGFNTSLPLNRVELFITSASLPNKIKTLKNIYAASSLDQLASRLITWHEISTCPLSSQGSRVTNFLHKDYFVESIECIAVLKYSLPFPVNIYI